MAAIADRADSVTGHRDAARREAPLGLVAFLPTASWVSGAAWGYARHVAADDVYFGVDVVADDGEVRLRQRARAVRSGLLTASRTSTAEAIRARATWMVTHNHGHDAPDRSSCRSPPARGGDRGTDGHQRRRSP